MHRTGMLCWLAIECVVIHHTRWPAAGCALPPAAHLVTCLLSMLCRRRAESAAVSQMHTSLTLENGLQSFCVSAAHYQANDPGEISYSRVRAARLMLPCASHELLAGLALVAD